ncbi:arginine--tRNA ligase [Nocardioides jiangxiensis]|uniref:Arginine--tRNA ligase n=1 Tax=Nocardioides jiangxiensis TaxID=3064524 RepID=A0ABT9AY66_9ACTN|nr:arginine--tRNA ligase [Nocardioides sp. WY-20]MDO7867337.1 arginine--tRNA ligase [Nocardioides sp. WY-20]
MTPEQLSATIVDVLQALVTDGALALPDGVPATVNVERPRQKEHGDYATNVALQLAKKAGTNPRALAELVKAGLEASDGIKQVEIAGPGFLNIHVEAGAQGEVAAAIVAAGAAYGRLETLAGKKINVEFISANPTGPLHLGHTRWAVLGDAIARVLAAAGADVTREFYINDRGVQMNNFASSIIASALGLEKPEDGYAGDYIDDLAKAVEAAQPGIFQIEDEAERLAAVRKVGYALQLKEQQDQLDSFNTHFDVWFSELSLHEEGQEDGGVPHTLKKLEALGHVFEDGGALWMRTTDFGDDKDRVLIKSDGELTYFASDTAYYLNKRARGFDHCIYLLGADHHGYVGRLKAMAACVGDDPEKTLDVMIGQLVKILRDGEELKLSKRAGTIVTLNELAEEIGVDALRYSLARYPADSPLVLDVAEITKASNDNPVYYVQYAHARTCRMIANAGDLGMSLDEARAAFDPALLDHERDGELLRALAAYPGVVASAADLREPHRVARYLEDTASTFNKWYDTKECRMLPQGDEPVGPANNARLVLVHAMQTVLRNGLDLLGVSAPERM